MYEFILFCTYSCIVFFFKQKTAYEMRTSDWSSDVCSSDLTLPSKFNLGNVILMVRTKKLRKTDYHDLAELERSPLLADLRCNREIGRASCRERVCQYV